MTPGAIEIKEETDNRMVFVVQDREENGLPDPDPVVVEITRQNVTDLVTIDVASMANEINDRFEIFEVFGHKICWQVHTVFEGAFAGTTITFFGPYLIVV